MKIIGKHEEMNMSELDSIFNKNNFDADIAKQQIRKLVEQIIGVPVFMDLSISASKATLILRTEQRKVAKERLE